MVKILFPSLIYKVKGEKKSVLMTFDDGPIPETTPKIIKILNDFNAKATFFCLGKNVEKHPDLFELIKQNGHSVGNHTHNHKNGWKTPNPEYFDDIKKADKYINSNLFRPPYGRIKPSQIKFLKRKYKIVMWDVVAGDFDSNISSEKCYSNVMNNVENGSVIVFHDSLKAKGRVLEVLPRVLSELRNRGYRFEKMNYQG